MQKNSIKEMFDLAFKHYQNGKLEQAEILFKKVQRNNYHKINLFTPF